MNLYYVAKKGVYFQGVYFISDNADEAVKQADYYAENDTDNYHAWYVIKYKKADKSNTLDTFDIDHIYMVNKDDI